MSLLKHIVLNKVTNLRQIHRASISLYSTSGWSRALSSYISLFGKRHHNRCTRDSLVILYLSQYNQYSSLFIILSWSNDSCSSLWWGCPSWSGLVILYHNLQSLSSSFVRFHQLLPLLLSLLGFPPDVYIGGSCLVTQASGDAEMRPSLYPIPLCLHLSSSPSSIISSSSSIPPLLIPLLRLSSLRQ